MHLDLTDEEARALARHLRDALDYSRYPFAPRRDPLKAILAKLDPPKPRPATVAAAASERRPPRRARCEEQRAHARPKTQIDRPPEARSDLRHANSGKME